MVSPSLCTLIISYDTEQLREADMDKGTLNLKGTLLHTSTAISHFGETGSYFKEKMFSSSFLWWFCALLSLLLELLITSGSVFCSTVAFGRHEEGFYVNVRGETSAVIMGNEAE